MEIPIIKEKLNRAYEITGYVDAQETSGEQIRLREKSLAQNLELEYFREAEREHEIISPKLTEVEWLKIFPEATTDCIISKITELENTRNKLEEKIRRWLEIIRNKVKQTNQWFWEDVAIFFLGEDLSNLDKKILNLKNSILTMNTNQTNRRGVTVDEAANAKSKLLEKVVGQAIKLNKTGYDYVGSCPFHEERTPSFHVFTKTNTYKCFGRCGKGGNSISFAMDFYHLGFIEAVRYLNNNY